jgi:hypothetical protein
VADNSKGAGVYPLTALTKRQQYELIRNQLELDRSSFISHWQDISRFVSPRRARFEVSDVNKGDRRNQSIIDGTATLALRTLQAGMMSGITPPSREWFRLTIKDLDLSEYNPVKDWLYEVTKRMSTVFFKSNLYKVLPLTYGNMGNYATAGVFLEPDIDTTVRFTALPLGSFSISNNQRMIVDTMTRTFMMTVRQIVEKFGVNPETREIDWTNISTYVRGLWNTGNTEQWVQVAHIIKPNPDYDPEKLQSKYKKFLSCYYESGVQLRGGGNYLSGPMMEPEKFLSQKGYDFFPGLFPRWELNGEDSYGTDCPGMVALGDVRQLQATERRIAQALEKIVAPPMKGPTSLRGTKATLIPGGITYTDTSTGGTPFSPAIQVDPRVFEIEGKQNQVRQRIEQAYFVDLFQSMLRNDRDITATEARLADNERLSTLGPVLEQFNDDFLDPLIDNVFNIMVEAGQIPPPPPELEGQDLSVDYISIFAQAQKLLNVGGIERFTGFALQVANVNPAALQKVDTDQLLDVYGEMTGLAPGIIRSDDAVAEIRAAQAQAQQAQNQLQAIQSLSQSAKNLAQSSTDGDNALTALTGGPV